MKIEIMIADVKENVWTNFFQGILLILILPCVGACQPTPKTIPMPVSGYNHTKTFHVTGISINGMPLRHYPPESGGAGSACCVVLPAKWNPTITVKIRWQYEAVGDSKAVPPPPQSALVKVQNYANPATVNIHFFDNHKIKVIVSRCDIQHPRYPISEQERFPFKKMFEDTPENAELITVEGGC